MAPNTCIKGTTTAQLTALILITLVLLNVAATRGPAALWPGYKIQEEESGDDNVGEE